MAIFRVEKNKNYTVISNYHLKEKEMSLKAKGLLSLMLSLPDNWDYSIIGLVAICKENETAIKNTLSELKSFGYLEVIKRMPNETASGRIEYEYVIYEAPQEQGVKKQGLENLCVENQPVDNHTQLNTNKQLTNDKKTNLILCPEIEILNYLNEKAGTHYKPVASNLKFIKARLKDYTEEELKLVVDKKVKEWKETNMQMYLRPETLFNATKFESYINGLEKIDVTLSGKKNTAIIHQRKYTNEELNSIKFNNFEDWGY